MITITKQGAFDADVMNAINRNFANLYPTQGLAYFVDPALGNDSNDGLTPQTAKKTLLAGYTLCRGGQNEIVYLLANGLTSGTARVDASFTWAKNETHLVGVCAPVQISQRARIAPTSSTTAFTPFFTISGSGCIFQNIQWFYGFDTGVASAIGVLLTGSRNYFGNCHIAGMGDAASAQSAGSRSLKIGASGSGENVFENCTIGLDTVTRTAANASVEFTGGTARNVFRNCLFPLMTSSASALGVIGTGAACMDRFQLFDNCIFFNAIKSTSTVMTVLAALSSASPGGLMLFKQCVLVGITDYGDANALANSYIDGFTGAAATSGIAVNPS